MTLQKSTIRAKHQEKIAEAIVYICVGITLSIVITIIGYVLFKGFVTIKDRVYDVTPSEHMTLTEPSFPEAEFFLIAHTAVRVDDITMQELIDCYTRRRQSNWGDMTKQNLKVRPFMYAKDSSYYESASSAVQARENDTFGSYVTFVESPSDMLAYVSDIKGAIGLIPADVYTADDLHQVKIIPIRRTSLIVNSSVTDIFNNRQLRKIPSDAIKQIFSGTVTNWDEVGGPDLSIVPIAYDDGIYQDLYPDGSAHGGKVFHDKEEFFQAVKSTPGAVGLTLYKDIAEHDLTVLKVIRHEVRHNLDWHYVVEAPARSGAWGGISTIIVNTFVLILFTLLFSAPVGIMAAIYLIEYAAENRFIRILQLGTETLAGIPSIVFGLFGYIFFVNVLNLGIGFISATLTVTLMVLPTIIRTSEESMKSVPIDYREGSLALGATKLTTIYKVVLPAASPGILSGVILAVGRVIGESAVLIYTLGSNYELVTGPTSSARVLSLHIYYLFAEAISFERCFSTSTVLIFMILLINFSANTLIGRIYHQQRS